MQIDLKLFTDILSIDSTSGAERNITDFLFLRLATGVCRVERLPASDAPDAPENLLFSWGTPRILFCTHVDTVPPYIAPKTETLPDGDILITGRGACDAKGQIMAMYTACVELEKAGKTDFGLLLLFGEETGSFGAKAFRQGTGAEYVVVGEPTDNCMVSASKGTKAFAVKIHGKSFHSGYPQYGASAIERFVDIVNKIRRADFPVDPLLGHTTYNIGRLEAENPQNILCPEVTCRIYFRTTFLSDSLVGKVMDALRSDMVEIEVLGGDTPMSYYTIPGFPTKVVAFGSDAPQLTNCAHKMLCGPGSILVAHRPEEEIHLSDIEHAVCNYIKIYDYIFNTESK